MSRRDCLLAALVALVWGLNFVVIDWGMQGVPPLLFLALRFCAVLVPAIWLVPRPTVGWRVVLAVGAFMSLGQFAFLYLALDVGLSPGLASLVLQAQVILTILLAAGVLRERPTTAQAVGVGVGAVGLLVVALGRGGSVPLIGLGLCLLAALSWAVGNVVARSAGAVGGLSLTVWSALVVPVPALLLSLLVDGPDGVVAGLGAFGWEAALSTLYTAGLASLLGYGLFNGLLGRNPSAQVVPWILLVPVVGMTTAWLLLDEVPTRGELGGGVLLVVGVLVALRGGARRRRRRGVVPAGPPPVVTAPHS